jgi:hypothetical protein
MKFAGHRVEKPTPDAVAYGKEPSGETIAAYTLLNTTQEFMPPKPKALLKTYCRSP